MRYWHGAMVNVSGTGTEMSLNVPYRFVRPLGLAIVVGLVKRAKTQSWILVRIRILTNFVIMMMMTVTGKGT